MQAYQNLQELLNDVKDLNLLSFTNSASQLYKQLVQDKIRIGTNDLRIAAIALSLNATVVTRNTQYFAKVPNLKLENWAINDEN
ncbi:type II toxin-antitoxin system VapC family toxin [Spirulina sp. CS-785/01]|uniref:type II toxin-antitoxin system VapC family toxin n=1 Tax=Spirulina sp. CS-785/01 TaxID=3021716 RepID=UPI00232B4FD5|nr:type II toxin-antitoxin system VapC family toxin [Spirulina sp. CS-785/01]MDB9313499.1 type II toxin-antitoxin system VapC family toxin [Spirulina sp. CS-785/01]